MEEASNNDLDSQGKVRADGEKNENENAKTSENDPIEVFILFLTLLSFTD